MPVVDYLPAPRAEGEARIGLRENIMVSQDHQKDFSLEEGETRTLATLTIATTPETDLCPLLTPDRLHESEQHLREFANSMPLIIWTARPDGAFDYYNLRWFTYTGMGFEQMCGWGWQSVVYPDDLPLCLHRWHKAIQSGEPYEVECRYRRFDGVYRWHLSRALPLRDDVGATILWVGSCTDIDDQKRAEKKLVQRAAQQAAISRLSQQALTGDELANLFHTVNTHLPQVLELDYCSIAEVHPNGTAVHYWSGLNGVAMQETMLPEEATLTNYIFHSSEPVLVDDCRADKRFTLSPSLRAHAIISCLGVVISVQQRPFGILAVFCSEARTFVQDEVHLLQTIANVLATAIERKKVQAELEYTNKALQQANKQLQSINQTQNTFVSVVSHEFRTTLTSIQGFSELMRDEDFSAGEIKEYAADINVDARRLNRMITELLDLERMKSGRMMLNLEQVDLNAIITDVLDHQRPNAPQHRFLLELEEPLPQLTADRDKLTQVVTNLVNNAIKYSPNGGDLLVNSSVVDGLVHMSVHDNGIGIPSEALEKVFDPYYRIESNASHYIKGTGLGLPIVRQIVRMHGGKTWAESTPGHGSTFHVMLPYTGGATAPLEHRESE